MSPSIFTFTRSLRLREYFILAMIMFSVSLTAGLLATMLVYTVEEQIGRNNNHTDSSSYDCNDNGNNLVVGYIVDVASNSNIILIKAN